MQEKSRRGGYESTDVLIKDLLLLVKGFKDVLHVRIDFTESFCYKSCFLLF